MFQLHRLKPNFVRDRSKQTYSEVYGLDVSDNGGTVFTARDNSILVSDIGDVMKRFGRSCYN